MYLRLIIFSLLIELCTVELYANETSQYLSKEEYEEMERRSKQSAAYAYHIFLFNKSLFAECKKLDTKTDYDEVLEDGYKPLQEMQELGKAFSEKYANNKQFGIIEAKKRIQERLAAMTEEEKLEQCSRVYNNMKDLDQRIKDIIKRTEN